MAKQTRSSDISDIEIREALERSGYLLESRLATVFRRNGFDVFANQPYQDPHTEKSREVDLLATLAEPYTPNEDNTDYVSIQLVTECVHPPQPVAFFTAPVSTALSPDRLPLSFACLQGWPRHMPLSHPETNWQWLWGHTGLHDRHHYAKCRIATQFCSFENKRSTNEWFATHREADHESFKSLCAAFDYTLRLFYSSDSEPWTERSLLQLTASYPVMVIQGRMMDVRLTRDNFTVSEADHLTFLRSYTQSGYHHDHLVDVVTERYFPSYLRLVKREINLLASDIRKLRPVLRGMIDLHYKACKRDPRCWGY